MKKKRKWHRVTTHRFPRIRRWWAIWTNLMGGILQQIWKKQTRLSSSGSY